MPVKFIVSPHYTAVPMVQYFHCDLERPHHSILYKRKICHKGKLCEKIHTLTGITYKIPAQRTSVFRYIVQQWLHVHNCNLSRLVSTWPCDWWVCSPTLLLLQRSLSAHSSVKLSFIMWGSLLSHIKWGDSLQQCNEKIWFKLFVRLFYIFITHISQ
jgi:hypothetical protein